MTNRLKGDGDFLPLDCPPRVEDCGKCPVVKCENNESNHPADTDCFAVANNEGGE